MSQDIAAGDACYRKDMGDNDKDKPSLFILAPADS